MARALSYNNSIMNIIFMPLFLISLFVFLPPLFLINLILNFYNYLMLTTENVKGKTVLITGASSGIGESMAYEYARRGANLVLIARREDQLKKVAEKARAFGSKVLPVCGDVSNVNECKRFVEETINHFGRLDHLVNNAGITTLCLIEDVTDVKILAPVMDVNFWGSIYPTIFAIPHLKKTRGKIIVNSSSTALLNPPGMSFYCASKSGLLSFYGSIRGELAPDISITIATLGYVDSEMTRGKHLSTQGTMQVNSRLANDVISRFPVISSGDCAKAIVDAACQNKKNVTEPKYFKVFFIFKYFCPELMEWYYTKVYNIRSKILAQKSD